MGETGRNGDVSREPEEQMDSTEELRAEGDTAEFAGILAGEGEVTDLEELRRRLDARGRHLRELYDEVTATKLTADEARSRMEAGEERARDLEEERDYLRERVRDFEREERRRRRRREGHDRRVARLEREIERRDAEIERLGDLIEARRGETKDGVREAETLVARKDAALGETLRRIEGLESDLEERETEIAELHATLDRLRTDLDLEYELKRRLADPANRLRAGIELFNDSGQLRSVGSISKSLGQPKVRVELGDEEDEPPVVLTFTWRNITWQTYHADPSPAVEEPRVYLAGAGENLSGADRKPSNARIGPGGRVVLGL